MSDVQLAFRYVQRSISLLLALSADRVTYGTHVGTSKKQNKPCVPHIDRQSLCALQSSTPRHASVCRTCLLRFVFSCRCFCRPLCVSLYLCGCLFVCLFALYGCRSGCLSDCPSVGFSSCQSVCLSVCLSACQCTDIGIQMLLGSNLHTRALTYLHTYIYAYRHACYRLTTNAYIHTFTHTMRSASLTEGRTEL